MRSSQLYSNSNFPSHKFIGTSVLNGWVFVDFSHIGYSLKTAAVGILLCAVFELSLKYWPTFLLLGSAKPACIFALGKRLNLYLLSPKTCEGKASLSCICHDII